MPQPQPPLDVRTLRRERGLTQIELAGLAKVSPTFVQSVENGYRPRGGEGLGRIADALGVKVADLRGGA